MRRVSRGARRDTRSFASATANGGAEGTSGSIRLATGDALSRPSGSVSLATGASTASRAGDMVISPGTSGSRETTTRPKTRVVDFGRRDERRR